MNKVWTHTMLALILDGWNNVEVNWNVIMESLVNQCVNGVGRPLNESTHTDRAKGISPCNPISGRGSLRKESTHWNGREVNRWISYDWELINACGNPTKIMVRHPQKELGTNLHKETQVFMHCQFVIINSLLQCIY